jgi:hypothetical protein
MIKRMITMLSVLLFSVNVFASSVLSPKGVISKNDFTGYEVCDEKCREEKIKSKFKKVVLCLSAFVVSSVVFYKFYYVFLGDGNYVENVDEQSYDDTISYLV